MKIVINSIVFIILPSILAALYILTVTTPGLQLELQWIAHFLPGKLTIQQVNGKLFSGFTLQNVSYQSPEQQIEIKSLSLHWDPWQLLQKKIAIEEIILKDADIKLSSNQVSTEKFPFEKIDFLSSIIWHKFILDHVTLHKGNAFVELNGNLEKNWNLQWKILIPTLGDLLPNSFGTVSSAGTLTGPLLTPRMMAILTGNRLIVAGHTLNKLSVNANIIVRPNINSTVAVGIQGIKLGNYFIHHWNLTVTGQVVREQGMLTAHIQIPRLALPPLGITVRKINLQTQLDKTNTLIFSGNFLAGEGIGQLQGKVDLNQSSFPTTLVLQGGHLKIMHLPQYKVRATLNLKLNFAYPNLQLEGNIIIPKARIILKNFSRTVTLPDEVVFIGQMQATPPFPLVTTVHINLHLEDKVYISYKNLQTYLQGDVVITQNPNSPATATGELNAIQGKYQAYGQLLTIQEGRLLYAGNLVTNPGLTIRAVKQIETVATSGASSFASGSELQPIYTGRESLTVGIQITGTVNNPQITLFSAPAGLNQADILSYLLLGYPQSQATSGQSGALLSLLSSFGPGGAPKLGNITGGLEKALGINELSVESTQAFNPTSQSVISTTSVVIGKKITPDLSLHYSVGLFYPISILNLRYQLSKRWAIQSETSTIDSGADILYGIEKD